MAFDTSRKANVHHLAVLPRRQHTKSNVRRRAPRVKSATHYSFEDFLRFFPSEGVFGSVTTEVGASLPVIPPAGACLTAERDGIRDDVKRDEDLLGVLGYVRCEEMDSRWEKRTHGYQACNEE